MTRVGAAFPFANLANTEILGTLTQFGTKMASRLESYAAADAFVNPQMGVFAGALRMMHFLDRGTLRPLVLPPEPIHFVAGTSHCTRPARYFCSVPVFSSHLSGGAFPS